MVEKTEFDSDGNPKKKPNLENILNQVVHDQHTIVNFLASIGKLKWKKYKGKNQGCHDLYIDLGISFLN
jgi:hypothetical protein